MQHWQRNTNFKPYGINEEWTSNLQNTTLLSEQQHHHDIIKALPSLQYHNNNFNRSLSIHNDWHLNNSNINSPLQYVSMDSSILPSYSSMSNRKSRMMTSPYDIPYIRSRHLNLLQQQHGSTQINSTSYADHDFSSTKHKLLSTSHRLSSGGTTSVQLNRSTYPTDSPNSTSRLTRSMYCSIDGSLPVHPTQYSNFHHSKSETRYYSSSNISSIISDNKSVNNSNLQIDHSKEIPKRQRLVDSVIDRTDHAIREALCDHRVNLSHKQTSLKKIGYPGQSIMCSRLSHDSILENEIGGNLYGWTALNKDVDHKEIDVKQNRKGYNNTLNESKRFSVEEDGRKRCDSRTFQTNQERKMKSSTENSPLKTTSSPKVLKTAVSCLASTENISALANALKGQGEEETNVKILKLQRKKKKTRSKTEVTSAEVGNSLQKENRLPLLRNKPSTQVPHDPSEVSNLQGFSSDRIIQLESPSKPISKAALQRKKKPKNTRHRDRTAIMPNEFENRSLTRLKSNYLNQPSTLQDRAKPPIQGLLEVLLESLNGIPNLNSWSLSQSVCIELRICSSFPSPTNSSFRLAKNTICDKYLEQTKRLSKGHKIGSCANQRSLVDSVSEVHILCEICEWWLDHDHDNECQLLCRLSSPMPITDTQVDLSGCCSLDINLNGMYTDDFFIILSVFATSLISNHSVDPSMSTPIGWVWLNLKILTDPFTALQIPRMLQLSPIPNHALLSTHCKYLDSCPELKESMVTGNVPQSETDPLRKGITGYGSDSASSALKHFRSLCPTTLQPCCLAADLRFIRSPKSPDAIPSHRYVYRQLSSIQLFSESPKLAIKKSSSLVKTQRALRTRSHVLFGPGYTKDILNSPNMVDASVDTCDLYDESQGTLLQPCMVSHSTSTLSQSFLPTTNSACGLASHHFHCVRCGETPNSHTQCRPGPIFSSVNSCNICIQLEKRRVTSSNTYHKKQEVSILPSPSPQSEVPSLPLPHFLSSHSECSLPCGYSSPNYIVTGGIRSSKPPSIASLQSSLLASGMEMTVSSPDRLANRQRNNGHPQNNDSFTNRKLEYLSSTPNYSTSPSFKGLPEAQIELGRDAAFDHPPENRNVGLCVNSFCVSSCSISLSSTANSYSISSDESDASDSSVLTLDVAHVLRIKILSANIKLQLTSGCAIQLSLSSGLKGDSLDSTISSFFLHCQKTQVKKTEFRNPQNNSIKWKQLLSLHVLKSDLRHFNLVNAGDVHLKVQLIDRDAKLLSSFSSSLRGLVEKFHACASLEDSPVITLPMQAIDLMVEIGIEPGCKKTKS